jgi:hypothetical protein
MKDFITIYYDNAGILISKIIAERFSLKNGYQIKSESEFWTILEANLSHNELFCEHKLQSNN